MPPTEEPLTALLTPPWGQTPGPTVELIYEGADEGVDAWRRFSYGAEGRLVGTLSGEGDPGRQKVISESRVVRDEAGRVVELRHDIDADGGVERVERLIYADDQGGGVLHKNIDQDADGEPESQLRYVFGPGCRLDALVLMQLDPAETLALRSNYRWEDGQLVGIGTEGPMGGTLVEIDWQKGGRMAVMRADVDGDGELEEEPAMRLMFDGNGKLVRVEQQGGARLYRYDDSGRLRAVEVFDAEGALLQRNEYLWEPAPAGEPAPASDQSSAGSPAGAILTILGSKRATISTRSSW